MRKFIHSLYLVIGVSLMLLPSLTLHAQPTAVNTNLTPAGTWSCSNLTDLGAFRQYRTPIVATAYGAGTRNWAFTADCAFPAGNDVWRPYLLGSLPLTFNTVVPFNTGGSGQGALYNSNNGGADGVLGATTANRYYTFNVEDKTVPNNLNMQILETAYDPAVISTVTFTAPVCANTPANIAIATATAPNAGEYFYVRYTTNAWATSSVLPIVMGGSVGASTLPGVANGTTVSFYVFSSPKTPAQIVVDAVLGDYTYDLNTLNLNNNGGTNYSYTIGTAFATPLTGAYSIPSTCIPDIATAVALLNANGMSGNVTFNVAAGHTENAPLGGINLNMTSLAVGLQPSATQTLTFQRAGAGANPIIYSPAGGAQAMFPTGYTNPIDGIFRIISTDYLTIDGINLQENAANAAITVTAASTAANLAPLMEFGYGFFKADATNGCNNNTIKNCSITLNRWNFGFPWGLASTAGSTGILMVNLTATSNTALVVTTVAGTNSNNKFYTNTFNNCYIGIFINGFTDAAPSVALLDQNNDIGGIAPGTGNTIIGVGCEWLGTTIASSVALQTNNAFGILALNQNGCNLSNNNVNSAGIYHTRAIYGVGVAGTLGTATVNANTVSISFTANSNPTITTSMGVAAAMGNATLPFTPVGTLTVTNNIVQAVQINAATVGSGTFYGYNIFGSENNFVITGNQFINSPGLNFTGMMYGMYFGNTNGGNVTLTGNTINNVTRLNTVTGGTSYMMYVSNTGQLAGHTGNFNNNTITNITGGLTTYAAYIFGTPTLSATTSISNNTINNINNIVATGSVYGLYEFMGGTTNTLTVNNNTVTNLLGGSTSGTVYGLYATGAALVNNVTNNTVNTLTGKGAVYGLWAGSGTTNNITGNTVHSLRSRIATSSLYGIYNSGGATVNITNNTVHSINTVDGQSLTTAGLYISNTTASNVTTVSRNVFRDIMSSCPTATATVSGIYLNSLGTTGTGHINNNYIYNITSDSAANAATAVNGIYDIHPAGSTANIIYNTIALGKGAQIAPVATVLNFGVSGVYYGTAGNLNLRNNLIYVNAAAPGTGTAVALRRSTGAAGTIPANYMATSNNNIFYAEANATNKYLLYAEGVSSAALFNGYANNAATAIGVNDAAFNTGCGLYKSFMAGRDASSFTENTSFVVGAGVPAVPADLVPTGSSYAESGAATVGTITTDYFNAVRSATPDIGAGEFTGTFTDAAAPLITYTALTGSVFCPTLTATITDVTGVNTTVGTKPRIWYKKSTDANAFVGNTSADNGWKYVEASNASSPFAFTVDYAILNGGVANAGDIIQYFIAAQDLVGTPNVGANSATLTGCATNVGLTGVTGAVAVNSFTVAAQPTSIATTANTNSICMSGTVNLSLTPTPVAAALVGVTYVWEESVTGAVGSYTTIAGATSSTLTTATITASKFFRGRVFCGGSELTASPATPVFVTVYSPGIVSTNSPQSVCGASIAGLMATGTTPDTTQLFWYATPTSTTPLYNGQHFNTSVPGTTTFYVAEKGGQSSENVGRAAATTNVLYLSPVNYGLMFNVAQNIVLDSVTVFPNNATASTFTLQLLDAANTVIPGLSTTLTVPAVTGGTTPVPLTLNFTIPPGNYIISSQTAAGVSICREFGLPASIYPMTSNSGAVTITNGWNGAGVNAWYYFYRWAITIPCESPRTPVVVNYVNPTVVTVSPSTTNTICSGGSVTLTASSTNSNYAYAWSPATNLTATTGATTTASPANTTTYTLSAVDGACQVSLPVAVNVVTSPSTFTVIAKEDTICGTASDTLRINPLSTFAPLATFPPAPNSTYCPGAATSTVDDDIGQVMIDYGTTNLFTNSTGFTGTVPAASVNNPASVNMYSDFTTMSPTVAFIPGYTYKIRVSQINSLGTGYTCYTTMYIDWNRDGDFLDANELYNIGNTHGANTPFPQTITANITVPTTGLSFGNTRMRFKMVENGVAGQAACGTFTWGEVEDYTVSIAAYNFAWSASTTGGATAGLSGAATTPSASNALTVANPAAGLTNGTITYTATLTVPGSACAGSANTTILAGNTPTPAPTTTSVNRCGTGTVDLTASYATPGYIIWYASATGGVALDIDTLTVGNLTSIFTTPVLGISTPYYAAFSTGVCESARTLAAAGVTPSTAVNMTVTGATTYCSVPGSTGITLTASTTAPALPTPYNFTWAPATGLFTNAGLTIPYTAGTPLATVYANPSDTTVYIATGANLICADTESVKITVHPSPYTPFVASTNVVCSGDTVIMNLAGGGLMPTGYCASAATSTIDDDIANVTVAQGATILLSNNSTGWPGAATTNPGSNKLYTDYTTTVAPIVLAPGSTYSVTNTQYNSGTSYTCYTRVFFDWNRDGDFLDAGESFNSGNTTAGTTATSTVPVPLTASLGMTRMRVVLVESGSASSPSCGTYTWGETEDYAVIINQPISYAWTSTLAGGATSDGLPVGAGTASTANVGVLALPTASGSNGTVTYILTMTNTQTGCFDTTVKPISVIPLPATPVAPGVARCGFGTVNLVATNTVSGDFYWYGQAVGGTALFTTTGAMSSTFTTPTLAVTDTFWVEFYNGPCPTNRVMVIATVTAPQQVVMSPAAPSPAICDGASVSLGASTAATPVGGAYTYAWTPATGLSATTGATVTCSANDTTDYVITGNNGTCSDTAHIRVYVNPLPSTTPTATPTTICTGGNVALAIPTTPAPTGYCANAAGSNIDDDIANVTLMQGATTLINNNSPGWPGAITSNVGSTGTYTDYTSLTPQNILPSTSYTLSVIQYNSGATFYACYVHVFFDWNRDGDFADVGEDIPVGGTVFGNTTVAGATVSVTFTTPNFAASGITRMRVKQVESGTNALSNSCVAYTWGETEDYNVNLLPYTYAWSGALAGGATAAGLTAGAQTASATNTSTIAIPTTGSTQGTVTYTLTTASTVTGCGGTGTVAVTVDPIAVADAGNGQTICYGTDANLSATSSGGANGGTWSGGAGTFGSATTAATTYTPALSESGSTVTLTWTTNTTGSCVAASDTVNITINTPASANAGADATICVAGTKILTAVSTPSTGTWSTPNGGGAFGSASSANTIYTPVAGDVAASPILLIWTTSAPTAPCLAKSDTLLLTVNPAAVANAGNGQTICYGSTVTLGASSSGGATSGAWTGGAGGYSSNTAANATYTPDLSESGSTITLTWTTNATGACSAASDTVNITINAPATVNAGTDISTCGIAAISLGGSIGGSATSGTWSGTYSGTFSSLTNPTGTYTPVASEIGSTITLTLTTDDPAGPCSAVSDNVDITIGGYTTTLAPPVASGTPWLADYESTDAFGWTHYYDNAGTASNYCDDYLLMSVQNANSGGNAIGHVGDPGFSVKVAGQSAYALTNTSTPYVSPGVDWYLMGRYWEVTPVTQPVNDVNVKFYFTNTDFTDVNAISPFVTSSPAQMVFYKINNGVGGTPSYNPDPSLYHAGVPAASPFAYDGTGYWQYLNSGTASTSTWAYSTIGATDHVAEYTIDRFSGGGGGGGSNSPGAFPVELLSFTGYNNGDENILQWTTTREMNNKEFILMHSVDNIAFEEIATVPTAAANGISNVPLNYSSKDKDFAEKTYYRLKQVDIDGSTRMYPATVEVNINNDLNTVVSLFPNPAKDVLNVSITQPQGGKHKVEIYDAIGKLVSVHKQDLKGGNNVITLDVSDLAKGTYIIMVKNADNGTVANTRFVKE